MATKSSQIDVTLRILKVVDAMTKVQQAAKTAAKEIEVEREGKKLT